jgi:hypothetical protein
MAWDPNDTLSDGPLKAPERRDVRRVLKWYERRVFFQASAKVWVTWLAALPTAMLALYGLVAALLHGAK